MFSLLLPAPGPDTLSRVVHERRSVPAVVSSPRRVCDTTSRRASRSLLTPSCVPRRRPHTAGENVTSVSRHTVEVDVRPYIAPKPKESAVDSAVFWPSVARFAGTEPLYPVPRVHTSAATAPHSTRGRLAACVAYVCQTSCPAPGLPPGVTGRARRVPRDSYSPPVRLNRDTDDNRSHGCP